MNLVAHETDDFRLRADEGEAGVLHRFGELRVLRQEAIARVYALRALGLGYLQQLRDVEVTGGRHIGHQFHGDIGQLHVRCMAVFVVVDGDGAQAETARGTNHAAGDFTAIGDEDAVKHG